MFRCNIDHGLQGCQRRRAKTLVIQHRIHCRGEVARSSSADVGKAIALLKEEMKAVPNQYPGKEADVELLTFNERGPRLAVRPYTHTDNYWQVYFDTNRVIASTLSGPGFPVPSIPVQMAQSGKN